jgi:hypothetical protein
MRRSRDHVLRDSYALRARSAESRKLDATSDQEAPWTIADRASRPAIDELEDLAGKGGLTKGHPALVVDTNPGDLRFRHVLTVLRVQ